MSVSPLAMARSALATVILESEDTNPNDKAKPVASIVKLFWHNIRPWQRNLSQNLGNTRAYTPIIMPNKFYEIGRSQAVIGGRLKV